MTALYIIFSVTITAAVMLALFYGYGDWLIDVVLIGLLFYAVGGQHFRPEAAIGIFGLQCLARRLPWWARSIAEVTHCHGLIAPVLFPGAVETIDSSAGKATQPLLVAPRITSSKARQAALAFEQARRARRVTKLQAANYRLARSNAANAVTAANTQNSNVTVPVGVTKAEAETIGDLLGQGLSISQVVKNMPGYSGGRYAEFKEKVLAVQQALDAGGRQAVVQ